LGPDTVLTPFSADTFLGPLVSDLSPLQDMKMTKLACAHSKVSDLSPLRNLPLKELSCDFKPERDAELLRAIKTLEKINDKPAKEFWEEVGLKEQEKKE